MTGISEPLDPPQTNGEAYTALPELHRSYYAATALALPQFPQLNDHIRTDICIVGGGFTGVAAALTLAERGFDVVLLEARRAGWGASGRNGGQLIGGFSGERKLVEQHGPGVADMVWQMRWRGHEIIRGRIEKYAIQCDLKWGYIDVASKPRQMRELEEDHAELEKHGFPHDFRLVDAKYIKDNIGTEAYIGGLINQGNGHLHPLNLCLGEVRAASQAGVRVFEQSPVTEVVCGDNPVATTRHGRVTANALILAGNAYHQLAKDQLSGILFPAGSFIMATEPLGDDMVQAINPHDLAVCDTNNILDYFRLSADRRLLFGGRCNYSGREPDSIKASLMPRMLKIYPQLKDVRIDYEWGGRIGIAINRVTQIGRLDGNVYYAQAYSGHGVNATHMAGEILADAVSGTMERLDLFDAIEPVRIPGGQWIGNQLVAMGMLYYRLRDLM